MPERTNIWRNELELEDGRLLEVKYVERGYQGYADSAERDTEVFFRLAGVEVDQSELPPEVTVEVVAKLIDSAVRSEPDCD